MFSLNTNENVNKHEDVIFLSVTLNVHTKMTALRFRIFLMWRAFTEACVHSSLSCGREMKTQRNVCDEIVFFWTESLFCKPVDIQQLFTDT